MRKLVMTMVLVGLMALPVMAQFGMFQQTGDALLGNKSVQDELKLSDAQKKEMKKITDKYTDDLKAAREDMDFEKMREAGQTRLKALTKFKDSLTKDQKKRFLEIEVQQATKGNDYAIFTREEVQKELKFTDKQKKSVKTADEEAKKDLKEVQDDLKESKDFRGAFKKMGEIRKEAYEKVTKALTDDQKKTWKTMAGKEFELKSDFGKGGKFGKKKDD